MKKIIKLGMVALTALTMAGCSSESKDVKTIGYPEFEDVYIACSL